MRKTPLSLLPICFLLLILARDSFAQQKSETEHLVICRNAKAVRTLRIEKKSNLRCHTLYTKAGVDQNIGNSTSLDTCMEFLNKVRLILEKAQWTCKDVKGSTLSTVSESTN